MDKERTLALQTAEDFQNWRNHEQKGYLDFTTIVLAGRDFRKFNFVGVDFSGTDLQDTNLEGADLTGAKL